MSGYNVVNSVSNNGYNLLFRFAFSDIGDTVFANVSTFKDNVVIYVAAQGAIFVLHFDLLFMPRKLDLS